MLTVNSLATTAVREPLKKISVYKGLLTNLKLVFFRFKSFLAIFVGSEHVNRKCHACISLTIT